MTSIIVNFGALGVFLLMVPESACIPVPSEATLLFAGVAVGHGWIGFPIAVVAATVGNLVGSLLAYGLGRAHVLDGVPGLRRVFAASGVPLDRYGDAGVLVARLLPLARTFVGVPAGSRGVPLGRFAAYTVVGSAAWAVAFVAAGWACAGIWSSVGAITGKVFLAIGVVVALWLVHRSAPKSPSEQ